MHGEYFLAEKDEALYARTSDGLSRRDYSRICAGESRVRRSYRGNRRHDGRGIGFVDVCRFGSSESIRDRWKGISDRESSGNSPCSFHAIKNEAMSTHAFVLHDSYYRLTGRFEQGKDLFAFVGSRIDRAKMLASLHFPDGGNRPLFLYGLVRNVFIRRLLGGSCFGCRRSGTGPASLSFGN